MSVRDLPVLALSLALLGAGCNPSPEALDEARDAGFVPWTGGADAGRDAGSSDAGPTDGGSGDGGTPGTCTREAQAATAPISLLDQLRLDVAAAQTSAERQALTDAFFTEVEAQGGTPLRSADGGDRVAFVARDAPREGYSVGGSFNGWQAGVDVLARVGESGVWALEKRLPRTEPHAYKLIDGSTWSEDLRARHVVWDGIDRQGVGEFNALVHPERGDAAKGRLVAWRSVRSEALDDARDVFIYVPASYDREACPRLPSLYFHDGNESLTRASFIEPADSTYAENPEASALLVFVALPSQEVRMKQYTFGGDNLGDAYLAWMADVLVPLVRAHFRTCAQAGDRGLGGASLGGLMSGYGAFSRPDVWGYAGSMSGSYFWENEAMLRMVREAPRRDVRWYVYHGCPNDNCEVNLRLRSELEAKGYEVRHWQQNGGLHDWRYWRDHLPAVLRHFREDREGCAP